MEELKKYVCPKFTDHLINWFSFMLFFSLAGLFLFFLDSFGVSLILILIGSAFVIGEIKNNRNAKTLFANLQKLGMEKDVVEEFNSAKDFVSGDLKMSQHFIFRKSQPKILQYRIIAKAEYFQYYNERSNNKKEGIDLTLTNGNPDRLCTAKAEELKEIFAELKKNNPRIEIITHNYSIEKE